MLMTNGEMESMGGEPVPAKNVLQETRRTVNSPINPGTLIDYRCLTHQLRNLVLL